MTPLVAVSQRVVVDPRHGERRDALDQRWTVFLSVCGLVPLLLPNEPGAAVRLLDAVRVRGLLLSGGNSLANCGGDAPERDRTDLGALAFARSRRLPVLGVCRGMQVILQAFGATLRRVNGHAGTQHEVTASRVVNSFHEFASVGDAGTLEVLARSGDGVVEAARHPAEPIHGIMWHPERCEPFADDDCRLVRRLFLGDTP